MWTDCRLNYHIYMIVTMTGTVLLQKNKKNIKYLKYLWFINYTTSKFHL